MFYRDNKVEFDSNQEHINKLSVTKYPIMKLIDMHFWQIGYERDIEKNKVNTERENIMMKRKEEVLKEEIKEKILLGVKLPVGNEPIKKEVIEKIIDNIVNEIVELKKISVQSIHM